MKTRMQRWLRRTGEHVVAHARVSEGGQHARQVDLRVGVHRGEDGAQRLCGARDLPRSVLASALQAETAAMRDVGRASGS